jgi:hypothetical protein
MPPSTGPTGCSRYSNDVAIPKLAPALPKQILVLGGARDGQTAIGCHHVDRHQMLQASPNLPPDVAPGRLQLGGECRHRHGRRVFDAGKTVGEKRHNGPERLTKSACEATREDSCCETLPLR